MPNEKINDIIIASLENDPITVKNAVYDILQNKIVDAIDKRKAELSPSIFNSYDDNEIEELEFESEES